LIVGEAAETVMLASFYINNLFFFFFYYQGFINIKEGLQLTPVVCRETQKGIIPGL
jgi:hypothetical protein